MNYVLVLASLLILVSCESSSSSKSKKCTYNDEPVGCSTMNSSESAGSLTLNSKVKSEISIDKSQFETLENTEDVASETRNGYVYDCRTTTSAGKIFEYKVNGNNLQLKLGNDLEKFTRSAGEANSIVGSWKKVDKDETGSTTITITITNISMEISVQCFYK